MTDTQTPDTPEDAIARVGDLAAAAADLAAQPGTAVVPSGKAQAEAVKAGMVEQRAVLLRQQQAVQKAADEAKAIVKAKMDELETELRAQMALLEPALKQLARLEDGVDALNIYLGRDEEIITLREGERAPATEPVSVRQLVLAMDEESTIAADKDGMDFHDIDRFGEWLLRDPAHVEQMIPEAKGVVAVIARRAKKDYGDAWTQVQADQANAQTWWLVRNGDCLWLTTTLFTVGNRTVPSPKEFTDLFVVPGRFGEPSRPMAPGSSDWVKAEERADARTRHYMKVALLLQGLLDRTTVFHPHDGASFLDQSHYDAGRVRVILDGENAITDGRPSYRDWLRDKRAQMHEGMRVIGAFATKMRTYDSRDHSADVRPKGATPKNHVPYNVRATSRSYYTWEFSFERGETIWDADAFEYRKPKTKATGYLDGGAGWWLPLDTITEDEIRYYLGARSQRHAYLDMIPALQAALAVKEAERETEAPFRTALIDALSREAGLEGTEALADELIHWFKTGNKHHRALEPDDAKAAKAILTEARRRARGEEGKDAVRVAALRDLHPDAMVIARRSSDFIVAVPEVRRHAGHDKTVFCRLFIYTPGGKLTETREWTTLSRAQTARWTIHHFTEEWSSWTLNPDLRQQYTDDELDAVAADLSSKIPAAFVIRVAPNSMNDCAKGRVYAWTAEDGVRDLGFNVDRVRGEVKVHLYWHGLSKSSMSWDKPTWETNWHGAPSPGGDIWRSEDIAAAARAQWEQQVADNNRDRVAKNQAMGVATQLEGVWEKNAEAAVRDRFVEDFGDISLWEGHRKTVKLPQYPYRWREDTALREGLTALFSRDPEFDVTGMTVAELLDAAGVDRDRVDESLLNLVPMPAAEE